MCGDGIASGTEQCDDGNLDGLDGCDADCRVEDSFTSAVRMLALAVHYAKNVATPVCS